MMKDLYRDYLFSKNILVCVDANNTKHDDVSAFSSLFAIAKKYNIKINAGKRLADQEILRYLEKQIPGKVTEAFYRGFPESVKRLSPTELLFDQLLHYFDTYVCGNFDGDAAHSVFEETFETVAFNEKTEIKNFDILTEEDAEKVLLEMANNLLASSRPLSQAAYDLIKELSIDKKLIITDGIASRDTAIKLLLDLEDAIFAKYIQLSDILKVVEELLHNKYPGMTLKKLNLKNQDRKFVTNILNIKFASGKLSKFQKALCFERRADWKGLLHQIHYKAKNAAASEFVNDIRNAEKNLSVMADFENLMIKGEVVGAAAVLANNKGSGAILRNLNYILSRCESAADVAEVVKFIKSDNPILLFQLIMQYKNYVEDKSARTFTFTKYYKLKTHRETYVEQSARKSFVGKEIRDAVVPALWDNVRSIYKNKLGKVYIDESMKNIAVPMQETTAEMGLGVLPKGTRMHIPEGKVVRAFTYWEKVNDIDLSAIGVTADGKSIEFSWRSMYNRQSDAVCFSGDQTCGYNGGSEYYDFNLEAIKQKYPTMKYLVVCNNVYSRVPFSKCNCKAGYMLRDKVRSGEVWEPKTVESSFKITGDSTYSYMFAIDVEKNDFVWLNMCKDSMARVAGDSDFTFLAKYIGMTEILNVYTLFEMMATEIVDNKEEADILVTDDILELGENQEQVKSTDTEKLLKYLNNK